MGRKILVVDDESILVETIAYNLEQAGYQVITAADGARALQAAQSETPDLIILDLMLPEMDGIEVCRHLRRERSSATTPIMMLTAKGDEIDKVVGLEVGADDYVTKPFGIQELLARIRAAIRRNPGIAESGPRIFRSGELEIDFDARRAILAGKSVRLTPKEFDLLRFLVSNANKPVPHRKLLQTVWGPDYGDEVEYLRVFINSLRKKIEPEPSKPRYLVTEPWVGYRFVTPD